jgi:hypothetical protein
MGKGGREEGEKEG